MTHFNRSDSQAVYKLAERKDGLGEKVKDAMSIIDQAVVTYGYGRVGLLISCDELAVDSLFFLFC